ncbi:hypothetical protein GCM10009000_041570 [Halobacterium noricense]
MLGHLESVIVDQTGDENRARKLLRGELWDDSFDYTESVKFVTVTYGLHIQRLSFVRTVYHGDGETELAPIAGLSHRESARVDFSGGRARRTERCHYRYTVSELP